MQTRMGGVARMSLPDATRSDRIYPLLQNLDLENLAFATLQGVGETLNIEEMNEDELRRLVLVNLARLTVAGEWNGLLTSSSGGGGDALTLLNAQFNGVSYYQTPALQDTMFTQARSQSQSGFLYYPFLAQYSGDVASISAYISATSATTGTIDIGIYSDDNGAPDELLGFGQLAATSTERSLTALYQQRSLQSKELNIGYAGSRTERMPTRPRYTSNANNGVANGIHSNLFQQETPTLIDTTTASPTSFDATVTLTDLTPNGDMRN